MTRELVEKIGYSTLSGLIVSLLEHNWVIADEYRNYDLKNPENWDNISECYFRDGDTKIMFSYTYPLNEGGELILNPRCPDHDRVVLSLDTIEEGLEIVKDKYPKHFIDIARGDTDGNTAMVLFQCIAFGGVIWG